MGKNKIKNGIVFDSSLNIIASLLLTIATQFVLYPYLGSIYSQEDYGLILTVMGIINTFGVAVGNSLNNTRLLVEKEYQEKQIIGDFNIIFYLNIIFSSIFIFLLFTNIMKMSLSESILGLILMMLISYRAYYTVGYRIIINYKKIVITNLLAASGYIGGVILIDPLNTWIIAFIIGELLSCIYVYITSGVTNEKFAKTILMNVTLKKYIYIFSSSFLSSGMLYLDRFLVFPLLGASEVSIYTVASYLGKTVGIVMNPISSVLLTYYAKEDKLTISNFIKRVLLFSLISLILFIFIMIFGIPVIRLLYPSIINEALPYFGVANLAAVILVLGNTIHPIVLRFAHSKWQLIIQIVYFILYLVGSFIGIQVNGLLGFCLGVLIANLFRVLFMIIIVLLTLKKEKN